MSKEQLRSWRAASFGLAVALLLSLVGWVTFSPRAFAASDQPQDALATITVNTTNPSISDNGLCSLIEAIENANADAPIHDDCAAGSGSDTIVLPTDAVMIFTTTHNTLDGGNALPVITTAVTIVGNGATLVRDTSVSPNYRFFNVVASGNLTLNELNLRNGRAGTIGTSQLALGGGAVTSAGTLTIRNSNLSYNRANFGGAIYSQPTTGSLTVQNTTFSYNVADVHGGAIYNFGPAVITGGVMRFNETPGYGGAILHDSSTLTVTGVTVQDNTVDDSGAGIAARALVSDSYLWIQASNVISNAAAINGGGIFNTAHNGFTALVEIEGSTIAANRASSTNIDAGIGGGILNGWAVGLAGGVAELHLHQSSVLDNVAQTGGGIANVDATGFSTRTVEVMIVQSTLANNTAAGVGLQRGAGGGLYNSNGEATVANSTLSGNQALGDDTVFGGRGGGIGNFGRGQATTVQLLNSTLAYNEATQAGGGIAQVSQAATATVSIEMGNSLIVSNALTVTQTVTNVAVLSSIAAPQVISNTESCSLEDGTSSTLGGNIEDGATCGFDGVNDLEETVVALGSLADNGGPTLTHLITESGAAFDNGIAAVCAAAPVSNVDQRGVVRPQAESCDTGAVEVEPIPDTTLEFYFPQIYLRFSF